jgi:heme-degrading monooxygenase HmoA
MRSTAVKVVNEMSPRVKAQKGFKSVNFLGDDETGEYGAFVLWETEGDAEAGKAALFPVLQNALSGIAKGPPTLKLFEVIEPKG